jgi:hypothetical protein
LTRTEAGPGDPDKGVRGLWKLLKAAQGPTIKGQGVGITKVSGEAVEAGAAGEELAHVESRKGVDERVWEAFSTQAAPGPGGVDALKMTSAVEFAGQRKVMEDAEDGLDDTHGVREESSKP